MLKGWSGLPVAFSSWNSLQASFIRFFSCSESTALTSRSLQLSSNSGHRKNCANLNNNNMELKGQLYQSHRKNCANLNNNNMELKGQLYQSHRFSSFKLQLVQLRPLCGLWNLLKLLLGQKPGAGLSTSTVSVQGSADEEWIIMDQE